MTNVSGRILKGENVEIEGQFQMDLGQPAPNPSRQNNKTPNAAQARVVETNSEFAVLEITCSCGTKIHVRCEYNN